MIASKSIPMILTLSAFLSMPVLAADPTDHPGHSACHADMQKYCGDVKAGEGRKAQCMKEKMDQFSPACREEMQKHRALMEEKHKACQGDVEKFCKDVEKGKGNVMHCLHEHQSGLSEACRKAMPSHPMHKDKEDGTDQQKGR